MSKPCRYFYQIDQDVYYINETSDQLEKEVVYKKDVTNYSYFEAGKDYGTYLTALMRYRTDFNPVTPGPKLNFLDIAPYLTRLQYFVNTVFAQLGFFEKTNFFYRFFFFTVFFIGKK